MLLGRLESAGCLKKKALAENQSTVQYPKQTFLAFPHPQYVLSMFYNFGYFSASRSCKKDSYKKCVAYYHPLICRRNLGF